MLSVGLNAAAGRNAYLAAFHAAQALIFEATGKVAKTHRGVQAEFARLTRGEENLQPELRAFLGRAYELKTVADYEVGFSTPVTAERAEEALRLARRLLEWIGAADGP